MCVDYKTQKLTKLKVTNKHFKSQLKWFNK